VSAVEWPEESFKITRVKSFGQKLHGVPL